MWAVPSQSPVSPHSIASSETAARREAVQPAGIVFDPDNEAEKRNVDTLRSNGDERDSAPNTRRKFSESTQRRPSVVYRRPSRRPSVLQRLPTDVDVDPLDPQLEQSHPASPWVARKPLRVRPRHAVSGPWFEDDVLATEFLGLFFDLVVVAVLTVFSNTHKIQTAASIPVFLSYYAVITWIWTSQVHYDVLYETEDTFHRIAKLLQIMVFVYMGAASGGWSPGIIVWPEHVKGLSERDQVSYEQATESFLTVSIAYIIYRVILLVQYLFVIYDGRRSGNRVTGPVISAVALCISCLIGIIAVTIPAYSFVRARIKVAFFYLAVVVEIAGMWYQLVNGLEGKGREQRMVSRYGAQTLIILGEGFVNLATAASNAVSGLSVSNVASYAQIFLVILIMYNLWSFLFSDFRNVATIRPKSNAMWELIHFPLHFGLLLLMAAMVNVILVDTFAAGLGAAAQKYETVVFALVNNDTVSANELSDTATYLNRLNLVPSFMQEYAILKKLYSDPDPPFDPLIATMQYYGTILTNVAQKAGVQIGSSTALRLANFGGLDIASAPVNNDSYANALEAFQVNLETILNDSFAGTYWLYPTAGGVLILCGVRSMLHSEVLTREHVVINGVSCVVGFCLALLGLLVVNGTNVRFDDDANLIGGNKMTILVADEWALAIVVFVYLFVALSNNIIPIIFARKRAAKQRAEIQDSVETPTRAGNDLETIRDEE